MFMKATRPGAGHSAAAALIALASAFALGSPARGQGVNLCSRSAENIFQACRYEAQDDAYVEIARCNNLPIGRIDCRQEALHGIPDAIADCGEQRDARLEVCEELGEDPYHPYLDPTQFGGPVDNPYFPLVPGTTFVYTQETDEGTETDRFEVTDETRRIMGIDCVQIHDVVSLDGEVTEDTLDWFAQDAEGNVWYFGERSEELEDGIVVSLEGSWVAGEDGAKPGIIMLAHPQVGDFYREEWAPGDAEDVAEVVDLDASADVPYGQYHHCLMTENSAPLEPDVLERKVYCAGTGLVMEIDPEADSPLELIDIQHD